MVTGASRNVWFVDLFDKREDDRWTGAKLAEGTGMVGAASVVAVIGRFEYLAGLPLGIFGSGASSEDTRAGDPEGSAGEAIPLTFCCIWECGGVELRLSL